MPESSGHPGIIPDTAELAASLKELQRDQPGLAGRLQPILETTCLLQERLAGMRILNRRLAEVTARASELVAEIGEKNSLLAVANAYAAELVAEIEIKNGKIDALNRSLAEANARAAELVAENEIRTTELAETNARLSRAVEKQSQWVGFAAHDLRGGIGGIHGLAGILLDERSSENPDDPLCLIKGESARLLELLSSLLEIARIEQGRISLQRESIDLVELTRSSLSLHAHAASTKNQNLWMDCADGWANVVADPHRIRQVIDNLVSNAIKFSAPGTSINVTIQSTAQGTVWSVTDEGPGLAPGDFAKLFQSFQKLSAVPTGGETSTGLGLALSRHIVELHLGRIRAENRPDGKKGARFSFTLPTDGRASASYWVIGLDTEKRSRDAVCSALGDLGHSAIPASDIEEVAGILRIGHPDAILADIRLSPEEIRNVIGSKIPSLPLIGLAPSDDFEKETMSSEWDGYLLKPVDGNLLNALLHRLLMPRDERGADCA